MQLYKNLAGNSGVRAFEIGKDFIKVKFVDGRVYTYNYRRPGKEKTEAMKKLALAGEGLSTYISRHVHNDYDSKSE